MAQMAHFSFPYYLTIPNSEIRILNSEIRTTCFVYMFSTLENANGGRKVVVIILFYILELLSGIFLYYEFQSSVVVVVALLFYVHGKHLRSCRDGQLT